tara:strand:- start:23 stop:466 length:444 start_codon:yes stop_codon:yes gene_type:complete
MPRDTSTGRDAERTLSLSLERGGYSYIPQYKIPNIRPNNKNYNIDYFAKKDERKIGIEIKWQQTNGTAEEKIPYALICLLILVQKNIVDKAYLVLGGSDKDSERGRAGWTLRNYYLTGGLKEFINYQDKVEIVTIEEFQADANQSNL